MTLTAVHADELLHGWKRERAYRVGSVVSKAAAVIAVFATLLDFYFQMPLIVLLGDVALLAGCLISFYIYRKKDYDSGLCWAPFYFGVWAAMSTSLMVTGGARSPFIGTYLTALYITGMVVQTRIRSLYVTGFIILNFMFWTLAEIFYPHSFGFSPDPVFMFFINAIVIAAMMITVFEFQRTEQNLAEEVLRQYENLSKARENLSREESANASKTAFLANISHELRTPLGAILGFAELLHDPYTDDSEKKAFAETIQRNGKQLSKIVDDLLDLSKVEAGKIELEILEFSPAHIVQEVIELFSVNAQKKGIELNLHLFPTLPRLAKTDPTRLKQVLINMIGNAIKFTERGSVQVIVQYFPETSILQIDIKDTGRGLTQEEQQKLFKPFSQADASVNRKYGGTGLGLNLSKLLAELMHGSLLLVSSQLGSGSLFRLEIPLDATKESLFSGTQKSPKIEEKKKGPLSDYRILVVDDIPDNQRLLCYYLEKAGATVGIASDGLEGIQKATQSEFDLILMDVQMPVLDGLQATTMLRQKHYQKPIFAVTAHAMSEDRERCFAAGFNEYLTKPVNAKVLVDKIKRTLDSLANEYH